MLPPKLHSVQRNILPTPNSDGAGSHLIPGESCVVFLQSPPKKHTAALSLELWRPKPVGLTEMDRRIRWQMTLHLQCRRLHTCIRRRHSASDQSILSASAKASVYPSSQTCSPGTLHSHSSSSLLQAIFSSQAFPACRTADCNHTSETLPAMPAISSIEKLMELWAKSRLDEPTAWTESETGYDRWKGISAPLAG